MRHLRRVLYLLGEACLHTFVAVLHEDMPFLVDSVRIELNRRGLTVHAIQNAVLAVARDDRHQLQAQTSPRDENAPEASAAAADDA